MRRSAAAAALALGFALASPARAQDRFEIQVYDVETAPAAAVGIETHLNVVAQGTRAPSDEGERPTDRVAHLTFEPHVGLARWCELGFYLQTAIAPDGVIDFAGAKLRWKARVPRRLAHLIGLALNLELSGVPARYEAQVWGSELRPVIDLRAGRLYAALNPIVDLDLAGPLAGHPQLQPAAKVAILVGGGLSVGAEFYAAFGALDSPLPWSRSLARLLGALDFAHALPGGGEITVNLGAGYNLPGTGDRWVVKTIVGVGR